MNIPARGAGGATRVDPRDRDQLREHPVSFRRVGALFHPHRRAVALVCGLIVATSVIGMAQPFLVRAVVDRAIPDQDVGLLVASVIAMVVITVVTQGFGVAQTWISTAVGQQVMHRLRSDLYRHLQRQSLGFFTRTRAGEVQSRITQDVSGMQSVVTSTATSIASNLTTVVATAIAMAALSWRLALLSLVIVPPAVWTTRRVALVRRDVTARRQRALADLQGQIDAGLSVSGVRLAKTIGAAEATADRFDATSERLIDLELRAQLAGRWRMASMQLAFALIPAVVYLVAGLPATSGGMTIGTLIAFSSLQAAIFRPLMGMLNVGAQWVGSMALFSRVFEFLDLVPEVAPPTVPVPLDPAAARGDLRFDRVTFRYPDAEGDALADVDLLVPAGTTLAVVGATGSGKSTLGSLVPRLADVAAGRVTIDGVDVRDLDPSTLAALVGVVTQETYLHHASIRDNLLLARPAATDEELWRALATAQVADLVGSLPDGLDTTVGARGHRFSGGEQQRLAIARTLLRDPTILVLDEATSALDHDTERALQRALDALTEGRTTVTIAHRLSTIEAADQIAVLDGGRVIERGSHAELLAAGGRYASLHLAAGADLDPRVPLAA